MTASPELARTELLQVELEKLQWMSRVMALLALAGVLLVPVEVASYYLLPGLLKIPGTGLQFCLSSNCGSTLMQVAFTRRLMATAVMMVPAGFAVWMFLSLTRLFFRYAVGELFSPAAMTLLRHSAVALAGCLVLRLALKVPVAAILSWRALAGGHYAFDLSFELSDADVGLLFAAAMLLTMARLMVVAKRLAEGGRDIV